jgi:asparagine synthase (glutamine-hydrolysing)
MCGIAGIINLDGSNVNLEHLDVMTDALTHRGPDVRGTFLERNVALGHRRLSILDLSESSAQPMKSEDGKLILVFNGEIYNFREKRKELEAKGYQFRSSGDTEVLIKLYEEYGRACLDHLRGMFAFAIYDKKKQIIFLARDRVGKKPLKYFYDGKTFAFASELKALRKLKNCPNDIDWEAIHHFLTVTYLPAPLTGYKWIHKLPAAHAATIDLQTGEPRVERYWL